MVGNDADETNGNNELILTYISNGRWGKKILEESETAACQMDRWPRQDCGESLDAGGIGPVTLEIN